MQISDNEIQKLKKMGGYSLIESEEGFVSSPRAEDDALIKALVREVVEMPDREDRVNELKAKIEAGTYNPTGDEIADAMIRRAIADRLGAAEKSVD
jgi:negative regulator of flagellin synthesis FlgM